jgi:hypothetical protein
MEHTESRFQSNPSANRRDPRLYHIASLGTLLAYGLFWLHFDLSLWQIAVTIGTALLTQYAGTRYAKLPCFDPKSALISSLSLCILLRTDHLAIAALASVVAIGSKFVFRWNDKHLVNPTNLALAIALASGMGWISPGQWGQVAWFGFLIACLGSLVVTRAARADVTFAFLAVYVGLLFARALWLGDPLTIPVSPNRKRRAADLCLLHDLRSQNHTRLPRRANRLCPLRCPRRALRPVRIVPPEWAAVGADRLHTTRPTTRPSVSRCSLRLDQAIDW